MKALVSLFRVGAAYIMTRIGNSPLMVLFIKIISFGARASPFRAEIPAGPNWSMWAG